MGFRVRIVVLVCGCLLATSAPGQGLGDARGCKDPPLVKRFPSSHIFACDKEDSGAVKIRLPRLDVKVEGEISRYAYDAEGATAANLYWSYRSALKKAGFTLIYDNVDESWLTGRLEADSEELWVEVRASDWRARVTLVERRLPEPQGDGGARDAGPRARRPLRLGLGGASAAAELKFPLGLIPVFLGVSGLATPSEEQLIGAFGDGFLRLILRVAALPLQRIEGVVLHHLLRESGSRVLHDGS
jgi:hypothetical protein